MPPAPSLSSACLPACLLPVRRSLEYRLDAGGRHCALCGHSPMRHFNWLNRFVLNPIKQASGQAG